MTEASPAQSGFVLDPDLDMRIGLNLLYMIPRQSGGTETYAAGLLEGLSEVNRQHEFIVFVNQESSDWPLPESADFTRVVCPVAATSRSSRYVFEQFRLPGLVKEYKVDLLHSLGYVQPLILSCKSIVSILDIVYDYPVFIPFAKKQLLKFLVVAGARRSDHILTISQASQSQIVSRLKVRPEKVSVTLLAPKTRTTGDDGDRSGLARFGIAGKYLLALSRLSPSKNIPMLLRAFARLPENLLSDLQLVLAGHEPPQGTSIRETVNSLGLQDKVVFTGYLSDDDLSLTLKHATVFVFPSLYEGFGIPVLEAMAAGVPVACSNVSSLPEVVADAALFFDPYSQEEIVTVLERLLTTPELRRSLISNGYRNLKRFSWKATAERTLEAYERVASPQGFEKQLRVSPLNS